MLSPYGRRKGSGLSIVVNAVHTLVAVMNEERLFTENAWWYGTIGLAACFAFVIIIGANDYHKLFHFLRLIHCISYIFVPQFPAIDFCT